MDSSTMPSAIHISADTGSSSAGEGTGCGPACGSCDSRGHASRFGFVCPRCTKRVGDPTRPGNVQECCSFRRHDTRNFECLICDKKNIRELPVHCKTSTHIAAWEATNRVIKQLEDMQAMLGDAQQRAANAENVAQALYQRVIALENEIRRQQQIRLVPQDACSFPQQMSGSAGSTYVPYVLPSSSSPGMQGMSPSSTSAVQPFHVPPAMSVPYYAPTSCATQAKMQKV